MNYCEKVSVVIPCYNHGEYIEETLKSVFKSSYKNIEIIIVNDGSDDVCTKNILAKLSHPSVKIINQKNYGVSDARNIGISEASGEYILPLDADDIIDPSYIEKAVIAINEGKGDIIYCKYNLFGNLNFNRYLPDYSLDTMLVENCIFCSALFRKVDWAKAGGYKSVMSDGCEDWEFWLSLIENGAEPYQIPEILFHYRQHDLSRTSFTRDKHVYFNIRKNVMKLHYKLYVDNIEKIIFKLLISMLGVMSMRTKIEGMKLLLKNIFSFNKISKTLSGFFVKKFNRQKIRVQNSIVEYKYHCRLKKIKTNVKQRNLRVIFLCSEPAKWKYDSLYKEMEQSGLYEPLVLIYPLVEVHTGEDIFRNKFEEYYNFFKQKGMNVAYSYDFESKEYLSLKDFNPDIIFYEQQFDIPSIYRPDYVSSFALTMYASYSYEILDDINNYTNDFHRKLFKYFVEDSLQSERYERYSKGNSDNCVVVGYPKLDFYVENVNTEKRYSTKRKIIYAPHHSLEEDGLKFSTFRQNGFKMLELAEKYKNETEWIFKPHPRLKHALYTNQIMTESQIEDYYKKWEEIGLVYESGDYFPLFLESDCMITDCISFLAEYLPSGKPLIRPVNSNAVKFNNIGKFIAANCYNVYDNDELEKIFERVVLNKDDFLKEKRLDKISRILDFNETSAKKILSVLKKEGIRR